ncbi:hypothetical protein L3Q72_21260 [Vibrio sp. JC009]|uniref:hypothetical protein n=1 Tax=Vibrio sp. JC009 TaxID=2912314 RepID=UPI0023B01204|nr:hypothetical protein [Vibrio sp. JC009]WED23768.1 hypothetical protein L3Q72_21260 [Vibrio sp. JC009]
MTARTLLITGFFVAVGLQLATLFVLNCVRDKDEELYQSQLDRYASYLLADELRQSSDDLTRMARTYVITQDEKYEKMYWDILAIRNGELNRPAHMNRIYWDLMLNYGEKPRPDTELVSLHDLMVHAGFTLREFAMLKEAQDNSDALVETETVAMNAVKGLYNDGFGNYVIEGKADIEMATSIMHDEKYHQDKASIMSPLNDFLTDLDMRTIETVEEKKREVAYYLDLLTLCFSLTLALMFVAAFVIYKRYPNRRK